MKHEDGLKLNTRYRNHVLFSGDCDCDCVTKIINCIPKINNII